MCPDEGDPELCHYLARRVEKREDCGNVNIGMMALASRMKEMIRQKWQDMDIGKYDL